MNRPARVVIADANILINLCHAGQLSLIEELPGFEFVISEEVDAEITDRDQRSQCDALFGRGKVERTSIASLSELTIYAELRPIMGSREASCIAIAQCRGLYLASDERGAFLREAKARVGERKLLTTPSLFVLAIRGGLITVDIADTVRVFTQRAARALARELARR